MKAVVFDGTHDKKGFTHGLVEAFLDGVKSVNPSMHVEWFDLLNEDIGFCRGCNKCTEDEDPVNADCVISDVCEKMKSEGLDADLVVLATPIYEYSVSSSMKRFLERCLTMVTFKYGPTARGKPVEGKQGVFFAASGAPYPINHFMGITWYPWYILRLGLKLFQCSSRHRFFAGGGRGSEKTWSKYMDKAGKLGVEVAKSFN